MKRQEYTSLYDKTDHPWLFPILLLRVFSEVALNRSQLVKMKKYIPYMSLP